VGSAAGKVVDRGQRVREDGVSSMCRSLLQLSYVLQRSLIDGGHLTSLDGHVVGQPGFNFDI